MASDWGISIAYDSEANEGYMAGWGFSALVSRGGRMVLFDCGWDGHMLRHNLGRMGVSFADIDKVVVSHAHWDHLSGLAEVLSEPVRSDDLEVFVPASFSENLKKEISRRAKLREVDGPVEVLAGVVSTGQLGGPLMEQSLVIVDGGKGIVITGCAHPGLGVVLARAGELARPSWLVGGLHGAKAAYLPPDLERLVLCHCTRERQAMIDAFPGRASAGRVGDALGPLGRPCGRLSTFK